MTPQFIRPSEAARMASVSLRTVYNWIENKKIPSRLIGRIRLIKVTDLEKFLTPEGVR